MSRTTTPRSRGRSMTRRKRWRRCRRTASGLDDRISKYRAPAADSDGRGWHVRAPAPVQPPRSATDARGRRARSRVRRARETGAKPVLRGANGGDGRRRAAWRQPSRRTRDCGASSSRSFHRGRSSVAFARSSGACRRRRRVPRCSRGFCANSTAGPGVGPGLQRSGSAAGAGSLQRGSSSESVCATGVRPGTLPARPRRRRGMAARLDSAHVLVRGSAITDMLVKASRTSSRRGDAIGREGRACPSGQGATTARRCSRVSEGRLTVVVSIQAMVEREEEPSTTSPSSTASVVPRIFGSEGFVDRYSFLARVVSGCVLAREEANWVDPSDPRVPRRPGGPVARSVWTPRGSLHRRCVGGARSDEVSRFAPWRSWTRFCVSTFFVVPSGCTACCDCRAPRCSPLRRRPAVNSFLYATRVERERS